MGENQLVPNHVAIIMDGNGRWAKKKNLPRVLGHNAGMKAMKEIIKKASAMGVNHLTVYAFSTENWKRSEEEVTGIFNLLIKYIDLELAELNRNNVKTCLLGEYEGLPPKAIDRLKKAIETTKNNTGMTFNIALNYGSRMEITNAVKAIGRQIEEGILTSDQVDEETITVNLMTGMNQIPDPDLLIRTSGEQRISNYLLWQIAYSEIYFTDVLWPDFTPEEFEKAIYEYQNRDRRFGGRKI